VSRGKADGHTHPDTVSNDRCPADNYVHTRALDGDANRNTEAYAHALTDEHAYAVAANLNAYLSATDPNVDYRARRDASSVPAWDDLDGIERSSRGTWR
jgi:hypothetical protein